MIKFIFYLKILHTIPHDDKVKSSCKFIKQNYNISIDHLSDASAT